MFKESLAAVKAANDLRQMTLLNFRTKSFTLAKIFGHSDIRMTAR